MTVGLLPECSNNSTDWPVKVKVKESLTSPRPLFHLKSENNLSSPLRIHGSTRVTNTPTRWYQSRAETPPGKVGMTHGVGYVHPEYLLSPYKGPLAYHFQCSVPPLTCATSAVPLHHRDANYSQNSTLTSDAASTFTSPNSWSSFMSPKCRYDSSQLCSDEILMSFLGKFKLGSFTW